MKKQTNEVRPMNIGSTTLLILFLILCMFTFAAISLTTAKRDLSAAQQYKDRTTAYYQAHNLAEERLMEENTKLQDGTGENQVEYEIPIDDTQAIHVQLERDAEKNSYVIIEWKTINTTEWETDSSIPLLQTGGNNQ